MVLVAPVVLGLGLVLWSVWLDFDNSRSGAIAIFEQLRPGITMTETTEILKKELNLSKCIGFSTLMVRIGETGPTRFEVYAEFDSKGTLISKSLYEVGDRGNTNWIIKFVAQQFGFRIGK